MDEFNNLTKKAFYLAFGVANHVAEEADKNLQELGVQAQKFFDETQEVIEEAIVRGEAEFNRWNMPQENQSFYRPQASPQLKRQLSNLVSGDLDLADRLLTKVRQKHPDRSENWYYEKVIYDLERDRQNY